MLNILIYAMTASAAYAILWYLLKCLDVTKAPETFSIEQFLYTLCVGAAVAVITMYLQIPVKHFSVLVLLILFGAATAVIQRVLTTLYRMKTV